MICNIRRNDPFHINVILVLIEKQKDDGVIFGRIFNLHLHFNTNDL